MAMPPNLLAAQPTLPSVTSTTITSAVTFVEGNGWYLLALTALSIFVYYRVGWAAHAAEIHAPARVTSLQERMREQRIRQQTNWEQNSKTVVEQSKLERQIQAQQIAERRAAKQGKHVDGDSDDDNEIIDMLGKAIAAKGGKINGKVVPTDKKSGFASSAFNSKATNSGNGKKFGGERFQPKSK